MFKDFPMKENKKVNHKDKFTYKKGNLKYIENDMNVSFDF